MRWDHIEHCLTPCSVSDLGVGSVAVNTIPADATLLRCFAIMAGRQGRGRVTRYGGSIARMTVNPVILSV